MKIKYRLKKGQEAIQIVDGPFAGRHYVPNLTYTEIPPEEKGRFEEIKTPVPAAKPKEKPPAPEAPKKPRKE